MASEAFGGGITLFSPVPLNAEIVRYRLPGPVSYTAGCGASIPPVRGRGLDIAGYVEWSDDRADMVEVAVYERSARGGRRGLLYREIRSSEKMLECNMEWEF